MRTPAADGADGLVEIVDVGQDLADEEGMVGPLYVTGMRVSEALALTLQDLDLREAYLTTTAELLAEASARFERAFGHDRVPDNGGAR